MCSEEFIENSKTLVRQYAYEHLDISDGISIDDFDVYVTWYAYELGHSKALVSTSLLDRMYYEVTYNSIKDEIYLDVYKKFENKCIKIISNPAREK